VLGFVAATLAVVIASAGTIAGFAVSDVAKRVKPGVELIGETQGPPPDVGSFEGGLNVLVAASDSGGVDVGTYGKRGEHLNDVTMLLHVFADHTGLTIPFVALTEFQGVVGLSTAVGGVTVCIAKANHDEQIDFDLDAGQQTLVGQQAVQFLRVRYGVGDSSDLARISNQQLFLSALVRSIKTPETLGNPIRDYELAKAVASNMTLTNSLTNPTTLVSMALAVKDISFDDIVFVQYPGSYGSARIDCAERYDIQCSGCEASEQHDRPDGCPVDLYQRAAREGLTCQVRRGRYSSSSRSCRSSVSNATGASSTTLRPVKRPSDRAVLATFSIWCSTCEPRSSGTTRYSPRYHQPPWDTMRNAEGSAR